MIPENRRGVLGLDQREKPLELKQGHLSVGFRISLLEGGDSLLRAFQGGLYTFGGSPQKVFDQLGIILQDTVVGNHHIGDGIDPPVRVGENIDVMTLGLKGRGLGGNGTRHGIHSSCQYQPFLGLGGDLNHLYPGEVGIVLLHQGR